MVRRPMMAVPPGSPMRRPMMRTAPAWSSVWPMTVTMPMSAVSASGHYSLATQEDELV